MRDDDKYPHLPSYFVQHLILDSTLIICFFILDKVNPLIEEAIIFNNPGWYGHHQRMSKKREVVLRCLDHYINYLLEKQRENKKRGFPGIINEDIEKKIEGLNALKQTWNPPSKDKKTI